MSVGPDLKARPDLRVCIPSTVITEEKEEKVETWGTEVRGGPSSLVSL